jgi:hypothetical protein
MSSWPLQPAAKLRSNARNPDTRLRIIVLGYIIRGPIGGMAWHHLNYVLGLHHLGHEVYFFEDSDDYPSCYDPSTHQISCDPSYGLKFAKDAFDRLGLGGYWAYFDSHESMWQGPAGHIAPSICAEADLLLNVSGVNPIREWLASVPLRVYIDTDPAFTQIRHLTNQSARYRARQHNRFFTFAEAIGSAGCEVPDDGFPWEATRQPIVLDAWKASATAPTRGFTTVMQWDSYPALEYNGTHFGMKSQSFDFVRELPNHVDASLEIAMGGTTAPRDELSKSGWQIVDPLAITRDPWRYQRYLQDSTGEFSVAKHGYVASHSGWFSERTACYLATGRPAVVQDTGFSRYLPCGSGLWAFDDLKSAAECISNATMNYRRNCQVARELAVEFFDSTKVLTRLLDRAYTADSNSCRGSRDEA